MDAKNIETIKDLLENNKAVVQGIYTRIVKNHQGEFEVLKKKTVSGSYKTCLYAGFSELTAVSEFLESEEKGI